MFQTFIKLPRWIILTNDLSNVHYLYKCHSGSQLMMSVSLWHVYIAGLIMKIFCAFHVVAKHECTVHYLWNGKMTTMSIKVALRKKKKLLYRFFDHSTIKLQISLVAIHSCLNHIPDINLHLGLKPFTPLQVFFLLFNKLNDNFEMSFVLFVFMFYCQAINQCNEGLLELQLQLQDSLHNWKCSMNNKY